jgi:hypothetical protein
VRTSVSPSILSVFARRRRREVAIEAGSTMWLSIPCDDREVSARPRSRFFLELSEPFQQAGNIAGLNRMLRHLLPAARR